MMTYIKLKQETVKKRQIETRPMKKSIETRPDHTTSDHVLEHACKSI